MLADLIQRQGIRSRRAVLVLSVTVAMLLAMAASAGAASSRANGLETIRALQGLDAFSVLASDIAEDPGILEGMDPLAALTDRGLVLAETEVFDYLISIWRFPSDNEDVEVEGFGAFAPSAIPEGTTASDAVLFSVDVMITEAGYRLRGVIYQTIFPVAPVSPDGTSADVFNDLLLYIDGPNGNKIDRMTAIFVEAAMNDATFPDFFSYPLDFHAFAGTPPEAGVKIIPIFADERASQGEPPVVVFSSGDIPLDYMNSLGIGGTSVDADGNTILVALHRGEEP